MSYFHRWRLTKGDTPGHPFRGNQYVDASGGQYAGREVDAKGYVVPRSGDKVFQTVRGFGGQPVKIYGEVYGKSKLRVRITGNDALLGGNVPQKTYALSDYWLVVDDPKLAADQQARERKEQERKDAEARQKAEREAAGGQRRAAALAAGDEPLTEANMEIGRKVYDAHEDRVGVIRDTGVFRGHKEAFVDFGDGRAGSLGNQLERYTLRRV